MENPIFELQKKFNLFAVNSIVKGVVVSANSEMLNIKLVGGAMAAIPYALYQSYEEKGIKLKVGKTIECIITEIFDGIPYLALTEAFMLLNKPQRAFVKISGPQGVVVGFEIDENIIGYYQSDQELPVYAERAAVICSNLTKEKDYYKIGKFELEVAKTPVPKAENNQPKKPVKMRRLEDVYKMPEDWSDEYIESNFDKSQSRVSKDGILLGKCYMAKREAQPNLILLGDNKIRGMITERNGHDPKPGQDVLVRVIRITPLGQFEVEIIDVPDKEYILWYYEQLDKDDAPVEVKKPHRIKNGFDFDELDRKIFATAKSNGSLHEYSYYWLGHLQEVPIKNGVPFYENRVGGFIRVTLIDSDIVYQEGDIVYARLHFIKKINDQVTFTIKVVYADHVDFV